MGRCVAAAVLLCGADALLAPAGLRPARALGGATRLRASVDVEVKTETSKGVTALPGAPERWRKSTKQLATLGPASSSPAMLEKLFAAGVDIFRLNFSHGSHAEKAALVDLIRTLEAKYEHPIAILADLQGPKLRVGVFDADKITLVAGQSFRFDLEDEPGSASRVTLPHPEIIQTLRPGDTLLIDDGKLRLTVTANSPGAVDTVVNVGGSISDRKGVNTPSIVLPISPLTPKDRADLDFLLTLQVDWVALSFVQRPSDIEELQNLISAHPSGRDVFIMAKLEKPAAVADGTLEKIVQLCDGIMVARGDLGVEMCPEDVPVLQKKIINVCRALGKPVVVATQMLESMIDSPTPTRAECSDIATAIYDGADAVMLSAESAAGSYPEEAVTMQRRVISRVEADAGYRLAQTLGVAAPQATATDAITYAARQIVETIAAKCLIVFTQSGTTVLRASKGRPSVPILALTPSPETARKLALAWGVYARVIEPADSDDDFQDILFKAVETAKGIGFLDLPTDLAVVTAGLPLQTPGAANVLRVVPAAGPLEWPESLCYPDKEECI
mmetsp:Transcript_18741/g.66750  ORF Transcript_18741/g.66750 Transcript_18741/m.66750 type:complete len:559 (+) Transcript_18741:1-1677(+)